MALKKNNSRMDAIAMLKAREARAEIRAQCRKLKSRCWRVARE